MGKPSLSLIKAVQGLVHVDQDGDPGELTYKALFKALSGQEWREAVPVVTVPGFPQGAFDLMLAEEGIDQPWKWPGGGSGITLGYGCDIGADPASLEFWRGILTAEEVSRLASAKGVTGRAAAQIASRYAGINVTKDDALRVFVQQSLPREIEATRRTYPGIELFPESVLGAMTSVTYNRGTDLDRDRNQGDRRLELRNIADIIAHQAGLATTARDIPGASREIAQQILNSRRLWVGKDLDGLLRRRSGEAQLILNSLA